MVEMSPLNPAIHGIRVASVIAFSVCMFSVAMLHFVLILLQYDIRPPDPDCNVCTLKFVAGVNLRRHDT